LKSPLSRAFSVPHVHPRLRKCSPRCTLDCGFQTSESPALRGFVGGSQALATAALYLVLKSNGLHRPKIRLKKFGFSPKIVPANISKKLPAQVLSQTVSHPDFQLLPQTAHVRFHEQKWVHTRLSEKDRTQRLTRRNRGLPAPGHSRAFRCQRNLSVIPLDSTVLLYTYISRFSVKPHYQQQLYLRPPLVMFFNFPHKRPTFALTPESGYTLGSLRKIAHSGTHGETQGFTHAAVWSVQLSSRIWTEKSRRKRMHALRRVSAFSGVAAPLGCAYICRKYINFPSRILLPKSKDRQEKPLSDVPHPCF